MSEVRIGIIGGSGLGESLGKREGQVQTIDTPFGKPSSSIVLTDWHGVEVAILLRHGPGHLLNPSQVPYRANIFALKKLGVTHIIASGATGSLQQEVQPRDLVVVDQFIDRTYRRANTFYNKAAVHVELAQPFCPVMRQWLCGAASGLSDIRVHPCGTYVCMEGPGFSTRAESLLHQQWGADLIGMTLCPEVKLAREAEIAYAMVAMPTDFDCWKPHDPAIGQQDLLTQIIGNLRQTTECNVALIEAALEDVSALEQQPSPAHDALKLAIWSDKKAIDPEEVDRLGVLWGRYFSS